MPIKDPTIYPPYWKQFSLYIRFERAQGKCEQCGIENGWLKVRHTVRNGWGGIREDVGPDLNAFAGSLVLKAAKVVLTVAHLDAEGDVCDCQPRTGFLCANPAHVKAMCQKCHNTYDVPKRRKNRMETTRLKADAARGLLR